MVTTDKQISYKQGHDSPQLAYSYSRRNTSTKLCQYYWLSRQNKQKNTWKLTRITQTNASYIREKKVLKIVWDILGNLLKKSHILWKINEAHIDEMIYEMDHIWTADMKSSEAMILAVMNAIFATAYKEAWKIQDFNGVWVLNFSGFFTQLQKLRP